MTNPSDTQSDASLTPLAVDSTPVVSAPQIRPTETDEIPAPSRSGLQAFRDLLARHLLLDSEERRVFETIPDAAFAPSWRVNFNENMALARRVFENDYEAIEQIDRARLWQEKQKIDGVQRAVAVLDEALASGHPVVFMTDFDNDGSISQAVINAYRAALPREWANRIKVVYARQVNDVRGFSHQLVSDLARKNQWASDAPILFVTADNGVNNQDEWRAIASDFPNSRLIVTDHHPPEDGVIVSDPRTVVVNPSIRPTPYFQDHNISGADTIATVLRAHLQEMVVIDDRALANQTMPRGRDVVDAGVLRRTMSRIADLGRMGNLMDYVGSDLVDKPIEEHRYAVAMRLQPLLNTINAVGNLVAQPLSTSQRDRLRADMAPERAEVVLHEADVLVDLNRLATRLLAFHGAHAAAAAVWSAADFSEHLTEAIMAPVGRLPDATNTNAIEQLRPLILDFSTRPTNTYEGAMLSTMLDLYAEVRRASRTMMEAARQESLLDAYDAPAAAIVVARPGAASLFTRRFLNLAYNQENRGVLVVAHMRAPDHIVGSVRSLPNIHQIAADASELVKMNLSISVHGHAHAAGFHIRTRDGSPLTPAQLQGLSAWLGRKAAALRAPAVDATPGLIETDLATLPLFNRIQVALRGHLSNMRGIRLAVRLPEGPPDQVWVTDQETTAQVQMAQVVEERRHGYVAVATDFNGGAVIFPTESLRVALASSPPALIEVTPGLEGANIGTGVLLDEKPQARVVMGHGERERLTEWAQTSRAAGPTLLSREQLAAIPYFSQNRFGEKEFNEWEAAVLGQMDEVATDDMCVLDVEATGLGKAPKCFNLGVLRLEADPESGEIMDAAEFAAAHYRDGRGRSWLLDSKQRARLRPLGRSMKADPSDVLINVDTDGMDFETPLRRPTGTLRRLDNVKRLPDNRVIVNRRVRGEGLSMLVKEKDMAITPEFERLTGVSNRMLHDAGVSAVTVDNRMVQWLGSRRNRDGQPMRHLFVAHNLPYDRGVVAANFPNLDRLMVRSMLGDTAKIARLDALAYDATPMGALRHDSLHRESILFCDSPDAPVSVDAFIARAIAGKSARLPDDSGRWMLWFKPESGGVMLVNLETHATTDLGIAPEGLRECVVRAERPGNRIRYSVERLSLRAQVRNILLWQEQPITHVDLKPNEQRAEGLLRYFQDQYHWDRAIKDNVDAFWNAMRSDRVRRLLEGIDLKDLAARLVATNRALQGRFHSAWMFERVLLAYDPPDSLKFGADVLNHLVEQTHLPRRIIKDILHTTVVFKRAHGIQHALVHEQHNNLRFQSKDGQGLADVVYEAVLPTMLALDRFRNPFDNSVDATVSRLVATNIRRAMVQDVLAREYANQVAFNAYSMDQFRTYDRRGKTDRVKRLQEDAVAPGREMKLSLPHDVLMPGQSVYVVPTRTLSDDEVADSVDRLAEIIANEQVGTSLANPESDAAASLWAIVEANRQALVEHRAILMERFSSVTVERRDATLKRWADWLETAWDVGEINGLFESELAMEHLNRLKSFDPATFAAIEAPAQRILDELDTVVRRMNGTGLPEPVHTAIDRIMLRIEAPAPEPEPATAPEATPAKKARKSGKPKTPPPPPPSIVREARFIPDLDIHRRDPFDAIRQRMGIRFLATALRNSDPDAPAIPSSPAIPRQGGLSFR